MVSSEASGKDRGIRAFLQQATVERSRSGMSVAEDQEPAVGESTILERKPDAGNPHVRFDGQGYGNVVMVEIETLTIGESRQKQFTPQPKTKRASPRFHISDFGAAKLPEERIVLDIMVCVCFFGALSQYVWWQVRLYPLRLRH